MTTAVVRSTSLEDAAALRALRLEALADAPLAFGSTYDEIAAWPPEKWVEMATAPAVYVAELDGVLVGMARGAMHEGDIDSSDRWLFSMYVSPIARGSGTAQGLIAAVAAWAKSDGGEALCLYHSTDAPRARALYAKVGFVATGKEFQHDERPELRFCEMRMTL